MLSHQSRAYDRPRDRVTVSALMVYPVKSAGAIHLSLAAVEERGFFLDRRWMLVDDEWTFLSQRRLPRLACISLRLTDGGLEAKVPDGKMIVLPLHPNGERVKVTVWDDEVDAVDVGDEAAAWFTDYLGIRCRLVHMPDDSIRPLRRRVTGGNDQTSFADAYPLLLISEASLEWLNSHLRTPVPMDRFRPNIVVHGCEPFEEDRWRMIRLGDLRVHVVKPCARCVITTVDQQTGLKGKEPLATLARLRTVGNAVLFGQNCVPQGGGVVRLGDPVEILEIGEPLGQSPIS